MKTLKYLFHPTTICRMQTYIFSSQRRYLATEKSAETASPGIGPLAPELQVNNLTGDHQNVIEIAFNRPERRNALGKQLLNELEATIDSIKDYQAVRCILFRSMVPNVFCSGADLKERLTMSQEDVGPFVSKIKEIFSKIFALPVPTIAALD
ncbi:unnamed protein product, partial [Rotaria magnacalcarata]